MFARKKPSHCGESLEIKWSSGSVRNVTLNKTNNMIPDYLKRSRIKEEQDKLKDKTANFLVIVCSALFTGWAIVVLTQLFIRFA